MNERVIKIVELIIKDLAGRYGFAEEWEQIDKETQNEIKETWIKIINNIMEEKCE